MSLQSFSISPGASGIAQTHCDDTWKWGSIDDQYYSAGSTHGYCAGSGHRAVFRIKIPSSAASPTHKGYLTFNFNGVVGSSGKRTIYYGITTTEPPDPGSSAGSIPSFITGTSGSITYTGLSKQNKQLSLTIGGSSSLFAIPDAGSYIYLWLYNDNSSSMECYSGSSYYSATLYAEMVGAPTAPTVVKITSTSSTTELSYIKPSQTVRIRWSGAKPGTGGSITGYKVWYRPYSDTDAAISKEVSASSTYLDVNISNYTRGDQLVASVGTIGTGGLTSANTRSNKLPKVNKLPTLSTASFARNDIISDDGSTVSLNGTDPDSHTLSYWYSSSSSGSKTSINNGGKITFNYTGDDYTTYTRYFWCHDGYEYSSSKSDTIRVHSRLTTSLSSSYETLTSLSGTKYLKRGIFKITTNKNSSYIKTKTVTVNGFTPNYTVSQSGKVITFIINFNKSTNITALLTSGNTININFNIAAESFNSVTNSKTVPTSFVTGNNGQGIIYSERIDSETNPIFEFLPDYAVGDVSNENNVYLFNKKITLKPNNFTDELKEVVSSISVIRGVSENNSSYNYNTPLNYGSISDDVSSLQKGTKVKYRVDIIDVNGITYNFYYNKEFSKVQEPSFGISNESSQIGITPANTVYHPTISTFIPSDAITISIRIPTAYIYINGEQYSANMSKYSRPKSWIAKLNNESILPCTIDNSNQDSVILRINSTDINTGANNSSLHKNSEHNNVKIYLSFTDQYNLSTSFKQSADSLKIDFREKPTVSSFSIQRSKRIEYNGDYINVTSNDLDSKKVNPNEYVKFLIEVTDVNAPNMESYNNFNYAIERAEIVEGSTSNYIEIATGAFNSSGSAECLIKSAEIYTDIKTYKYRVRAKDSTGLYSDYKYTNLSDYDLKCFPANSLPNFNDLISFNKNGNFTIKIGNNLCGYEEYSTYTNLTRGEYTQDFQIGLFSSTNYSNILNLNDSSWSSTTISKHLKQLETGYNEEIILSNAPNSNSTTYYRIGLKLSKGLDSGNNIKYIPTWSQIYSIDPNNPVVSIRKSYLGINTGGIIDNEDTILLQINALSSERRKIIRLYDPLRKDSNGEPIYFEINLSDGSIDGAIISGGTW